MSEALFSPTQTNGVHEPCRICSRHRDRIILSVGVDATVTGSDKLKLVVIMIYTIKRPKDLQFSVADETVLQKFSDKVAKMLVTLG